MCVYTEEAYSVVNSSPRGTAKGQLAVQPVTVSPAEILLFLPCWHFKCVPQMFVGYYIERKMTADK